MKSLKEHINESLEMINEAALGKITSAVFDSNLGATLLNNKIYFAGQFGQPDETGNIPIEDLWSEYVNVSLKIYTKLSKPTDNGKIYSVKGARSGNEFISCTLIYSNECKAFTQYWDKNSLYSRGTDYIFIRGLGIFNKNVIDKVKAKFPKYSDFLNQIS